MDVTDQHREELHWRKAVDKIETPKISSWRNQELRKRSRCRCSKKLSAHRRLCRPCFHVSPGLLRPIPRFSSWARRALERSSSPVPSTSARNGPLGRSFPLTVPLSRRPWLPRNCLVMRKERSRERSSDASVALSWVRAARFSWTKLATCLPKLRLPYCECSRNGNLSESAAATPFQPTSESLLLPTATYRLPLPRA